MKRGDNRLSKKNWRTRYEFYNQRFVPQSALENLADYLLDWINDNEDVMVIKMFLAEYGIDHKQFKMFSDRCAKLKEAYSIALMIIGTRRECAGLHRKIDGNLMKFNQHQYDKDWGDSEERHAKLRRDDKSNEKSINIVLPSLKELSDKRRDTDNT